MLNDTKIRALKPKPAAFRLADTNGLCIEVRPTGAKVWRYRYRFAGKASIITLGDYPQMGLSKARSERERLKDVLRSGANPAHAAMVERATKIDEAHSTFGAVGLELLAKRSKEGLAPGSVRRERRQIEKDLAPIFDLPIREVTAPVLLAALRRVESRGALETAHRTRSLAGRVIRYAIVTGRADRNPANDLVGALERPKTTHFASVTEPDQISVLLRALWGYHGHVVTQGALKLAPYLFVRPGELRAARWSDIDLDRGEWRYVASKTGIAHIVPLASQVIEILHELRPYARRSTYVLPGVRSVDRSMSENTVNAAMRSLGFDGGTIVGHGFRAMARTVLDEVLGFRPELIEQQLGHSVRDPLGRAYNRTMHLPERKQMMQTWADYLDVLRIEGVRRNQARRAPRRATR